MRKIGVLTFHRCINYGSYWQARCLVEGLGSMGHDAMLLEYQSRRVDRAEWKCALRPVPNENGDHALYRAKIRKFFRSIAALPLSEPFPLEAAPRTEDFDLVLIGSDEVWNLKHPWYGGSLLFYGEGFRSSRLASYAASFGNQTSSVGMDGLWTDKLLSFADISVRDLNSARLIRDLLGYEPELVLDPCLQFPQVIAATEKVDPERDYIALYGHGFPLWFQRSVRAWAREKGYPLVSIGYRNDWADRQWIDAGPEEFAGFIAGARAVATNFFHGCVFALVHGRPFACVLSDYRSNKIRDLTTLIGADRRLVTEENASMDLPKALEYPPEQAISERIAALRRNSNDYLLHVTR
ncbi:polysaccharide pyruvyl transferase family protein [Rhizobium sp. LCM 4573]|uniref:polysaccharide pyruvyl transferase family protein n=1 Tax=Rhizobium sp. LCM 4573 TaxID=1848291 RepID=UPI0008D93F2C|nr:polysaccharide pyruvyl transferase family protein [Rhizobium sp. LCM 4573]OHV77273.1 hypothetical protein LCM4573_10980 [Rhizobium sp. LCM 4573]